jgi:hypothetical protein
LTYIIPPRHLSQLKIRAIPFDLNSRESNINFDIWIFFGGTLLISHEKLPKDGKVLSHLGFKSKVMPGPLTDLSAWMGFFTSSPQ